MTYDADRVARVLGDRAERGVLLSSYTTFRIGGPADFLLRPTAEAELVAVAEDLADLDVTFLVVGQGSNLLVSDAGFRGVVIVLDATFARWTHEGLVVEAGAAVKMPVLARQSAHVGLRGLEWMVGVPGSVGGAVCMNAGGHGADVADNLISAVVLDLRNGSVTSRSADTLALSYRSSSLMSHELVLRATFQCTAGDRETSEEEIASIVRWRRENQPGGANCGSVFTNPPGDSAGRLIDAAGLRGFELGTAQVSPKHANFIQADENATCADVWALIIAVRQRVFETFGVELHPEVRPVGFDGSLPPLRLPPSDSPNPSTKPANLQHPDAERKP